MLDRARMKEITEGTTIDASAIDTCARLAGLGIKLHLAEFGTGYHRSAS